MGIPLRIDIPPITKDPPTRTDLAAFFVVLEQWAAQVATLLDYGVLTRSLAASVPIPTAGTGSVNVAFPVGEPDTNYMIGVETSWETEYAITNKTTSGFVITFSVPSPTGGTFSWVRFR